MSRKQRLVELVTAVVEGGTVEVAALAERFSVSTATIRRDLATLEAQSMLNRTHGGATVHVAFNDVPLGMKADESAAEKRRIGGYALRLASGARVVGMTGGTTIASFARQLAEHGDGITIITNALNIATGLADNPRLRVLVAGGEVRRSSRETIGASAEDFFSEYNVDVAFLGVDGVDAVAGLTNYDPVGARVNAALLRRAKKRVVLADATKISRVALAQVAGMSEVDLLITDTRAPNGAVTAIRDLGCDVVCV